MPELLEGAGGDYLRAHARIRPIGARDLSTRDRLREKGIDAYFSGCLTMTFQPFANVAKGDAVIAVDLDKTELDQLRKLGAQMRALKSLTIDSLSEYMDSNEAFHAALVDLAKSVMLRRSIEQVSSLPFASPSAMVFPTSVLPNSDEMLAIANLHHGSIIEAISLRQGTRAESLAREHTFVARRALEGALSDTNALSRVPGGALINVSTT